MIKCLDEQSSNCVHSLMVVRNSSLFSVLVKEKVIYNNHIVVARTKMERMLDRKIVKKSLMTKTVNFRGVEGEAGGGARHQ